VPKTWPKVQFTPTARVVLEKRYLKKVDEQVVETPEDMLYRVATIVADTELKYGKSLKETHILAQ